MPSSNLNKISIFLVEEITRVRASYKCVIWWGSALHWATGASLDLWPPTQHNCVRSTVQQDCVISSHSICVVNLPHTPSLRNRNSPTLHCSQTEHDIHNFLPACTIPVTSLAVSCPHSPINFCPSKSLVPAFTTPVEVFSVVESLVAASSTSCGTICH